MYLTVKQQVKHLSKEEYQTLRELCQIARNLANAAIYNVRQYYFAEGKYLRYEDNYVLLKDSQEYKLLNARMAQKVLKEVDGMFKNFFKVKKTAGQGRYSSKGMQLPGYFPKDALVPLVADMAQIKDGVFLLPYSNAFRKTHAPVAIRVPPVLSGRRVREVRVIPRAGGRSFEVQYVHEQDGAPRELDKNHALSLDFGVDNLVAAVSDEGKSFIIDGRRLKSMNQWFNQENARLQKIGEKQGDGRQLTARRRALAGKWNRQAADYMNKAAKLVVDYCVREGIGILVAGYNETFRRNGNPETGRNGCDFVDIPFGRLRERLRRLCELNGIEYVEQEESYTSLASFWDRDEIPEYNRDNPQSCTFSGERVHRGLYRTASGMEVNADINGALNILRKSNVVGLEALYSRGGVDTPVRIRIA